jgi:hypothetical protein
MGDRRSAQGDQCSCRAHPLVWRFPFGVRRSAASALALALRSAGRSAPMADELIAWLDWAPAYEREHGRRHGEAERLETRVAFPRAPVVSQDGSFPPRTRRPLADGYYPRLQDFLDTLHRCPATMGNDWESSRHGNPDRGRVESSPWAYRISQPAGSYTAARMETAGTFAVMLIEFL